MEGQKFKLLSRFFAHRAAAPQRSAASAQPSVSKAHNQRLTLASLNPFSWSAEKVQSVAVGIFAFFLPIYIIVGLQPNLSADAANYPILEIPSISLSSPVEPVELVDHQLTTPATIAGSYSRSENKTLLIGHSSTVFKNLHLASLGDRLVYDGQTYEITNLETLEKSEISMNKVLASASAPTLIIMTCAGTPLPNQDATHRLLVTATLAD